MARRNSAECSTGGWAATPQINAFPLDKYYSFFILPGHNFSWLWKPELRGFSVCFFKSAHAYGWRNCTKCQRLYFSKCCSSSMVTVTESKGNANVQQSGHRSWNWASVHNPSTVLKPNLLGEQFLGDGCLKTTHCSVCLFPFPKPW